jgi:membrane-associated phospholipid phosphatase
MCRRSSLHGLLCIGLFLSLAAQAEDSAPTYPELVIEDVKHIATSPAYWDEAEWKQAGWAAFAIIGTATLLDQPVMDAMRRQPRNNRFMLQVERFGAEYAAGVIGAFYIAGALSEDERSMQVAQDSLSASIIASGLITPAIKLTLGRSRPRENAGTAYFKPFSNPNASFPSGHTTEAFAIASVVANHYEETWVSCASYSVAGLVGIARSYHDAHFASDILAGAIIGTWVGKSVVGYNQQHRANKVVLMPEIAPGLLGLRLAATF